jgi:DNA-directed RNA polymerase subunit RPC12/RpoP
MGSLYKFDCENCGYTAHVSGGEDCGMMTVVKTMTCNDCNELIDILIGYCGEIWETGNPEHNKNLYICSKCNGQNLSIWSATKRPCPKCDHKLEKDKDSPPVMWD